jgi:hypothetical protein
VKYLTGNQDVVTFYIDRAKGHPRQVYTIMKLEDWLELVKEAQDADT